MEQTKPSTDSKKKACADKRRLTLKLKRRNGAQSGVFEVRTADQEPDESGVIVYTSPKAFAFRR